MSINIRFLFLIVLLPFIGLGQSALKQSNVDQFPNVEFVFNHRNLIGIDTNAVQFFENGQLIKNYKLVRQNDVHATISKKQVLVLIENSYWPRFEEQLKEVKRLWNEISKDVVQENDAFQIATFDWTKGEKTLNFLSQEWLNDGAELNSVIQNIQKPKVDGRTHESTEIYSALREGVDFMAKQSTDSLTAKSIILFSSEFNNIFNNSQTKTDVIIEARQADIPIYAFRYPYSDKYDLKDVAQASLGRHLDMKSNSDEAVSDVINGITKDYQGVDYQLSFESSIAPSEDFRTIQVQLSKDDKIEFKYQAPSRISYLWKNPAYRYGGIISLILIFVIIAWSIQYMRKKKKKEKEEFHQTQEETRKKIQESEQRQAAAHERERLNKLNEEKILFETKLYTAFNKLPRMPKLVAQNGEVYEILQPTFTIGRAETNNLQINNSTLSKQHAGIYFDHFPGKPDLLNHRSFYLVDLESTNGTQLNGEHVLISSEISNKSELGIPLKNNDLIQMGELTFTFRD
jgi:large-conductance mechanosensitive channel